MYVVIMPTNIAKGHETQSQLINLIKTYKNDFNIDTSYSAESQDADILYNQNGIFIGRVTSDDLNWHSISVSNKYTATSNMTRFFFVAGKTASGNNTQGNFLDNVAFTQNLPPANAGAFNLKIVKKFDGLEPTEDLKNKMTFTIKAYTQNGDTASNAPLYDEQFKLSGMKKETDGSYTKVFENWPIGSNQKYIYKVEETNAQVNEYSVSTIQTVIGGKVQEDRKSTMIGERDSATFTVTNKYTKINVESIMNVEKTATVDNWDKRTYNINITASSKNTSSTITTTTSVADIMLVLDVSGSMSDSTTSYTYVANNTQEGRNSLDKDKTYYINVSGENKKMTYSSKREQWEVSSKYSVENYSEDYKIYSKKTESKLTTLKAAVNQFINDTAVKSPDSKIGITAFSSSGYGYHGQSEALQVVGTGKQNLLNFVNKLSANGGTDPAVGLNDAYNKLDAVNDSNSKYVILFTDGQPTGGGSSWNTTAQTNAEKAAKKLKEKNYTVYTIGFGLNDKAKTFLAGGTYSGTTYPGIASGGCAKTANDAASLGEIFREINQTITNNLDITGATVTDVIDPRFEIVGDDGNVINLAVGNSITLENGGVVTKLANGNYQVQWTDQTIPNANNTNGSTSWSNTIKVRAKDEYIGGNNIPTNVSPASMIHTGYGDAILPQPKVNVKSDLVVNNKKVTIFYGDTVPTDITDLFNISDPKGYITNLNGEKKLVRYTMNADGTAISPDDFTLTWYTDPGCNEENVVGNLGSEKPAPESKNYYLKVTYNKLGVATTDSTTNTGRHVSGEAGTITAYNLADESKAYGIYTVKVISGQIQITKKVVDDFSGEKTFTFNVIKDGDNESKQIQIKVNAKSKEGTETLTGLERGTYSVTEVIPEGYKIDDAVVNESTNCKTVTPNDGNSYTTTFKLGYEKDNNEQDTDVIKDYTYTENDGGTIGVVKYTNSEIKANLDLKKTDEKQNNPTYLDGAYFKLEKKSGSDWVSVEKSYDKFVVNNNKGKIELNNLRNGDYRLTEVTAPSGYMLLSSPISFTVSNGTVRLTDEGTVSNMRELTTDSTNLPVLTIKNQKLYSLPESGGSGIYWYMIGGMVLMSTAAWILYKNKCREVLGK